MRKCISLLLIFVFGVVYSQEIKINVEKIFYANKNATKILNEIPNIQQEILIEKKGKEFTFINQMKAQKTYSKGKMLDIKSDKYSEDNVIHLSFIWDFHNSYDNKKGKIPVEIIIYAHYLNLYKDRTPVSVILYLDDETLAYKGYLTKDSIDLSTILDLIFTEDKNKTAQLLEKSFSYLKQKGYEPELETSKLIKFTKNNKTYTLRIDENDAQFMRIINNTKTKIADEDFAQVSELSHYASIVNKVGKVSIDTREKTVSFVADTLLDSTPNIEEIIPRLLYNIENTEFTLFSLLKNMKEENNK